MTDNVVDLHFSDRPLVGRPIIHEDMERAVQQLQGTLGEDIAGFVIFAVDHEGGFSTRHGIRTNGPIGRRMLAALACEGIRDNLIVERSIEQTVFGLD